MKQYAQAFSLFLMLAFPAAAKAQQATLKGNITTSDGKPASQVNVQLTEINQTAVTNTDGNYQFARLSPGKYNITVSYTGLATQYKLISIDKESQETVVNFTLIESFTELSEIIVTGSRVKTDRITTIGKLPVKPMDLPQTTVILEKQVLERRQVQTIGDAVQNLNGVYVMGNTGGYQEELASRGFPFNSNNTFKNGVRFNNSIMPEVSGLENIEVLKGGNAILFGTVGAGGVLNIVTKKPQFNKGGSVSFQAGSYDYYKPAIDIYGPVNNSRRLAFRLNSSFTKARSFRDAVKSQRFYINPSFLIKIGKRTELLAEGDYTQDNRTLDFGTGAIYYTIANTPRSLFLNLPWSYNNAEQIAATVTLTHLLSENWQIKALASTRKYNNDLFGAARPNTNSQFIDSSAANYGRWIRGLVRNRNTEHYQFASAEVTGKFKTGRLKHTVLAGTDADMIKTRAYVFDYTQYRSDKKNIYDTLNIFGTKTYTTRNDIPHVPWLFYTHTPVKRLGLYVQDFIEINSQIKLLAGIRYSLSNIETPDSIYAGNNHKMHNDKRKNDTFSPRLGLVYQPVKNISLFASYTNTYELNTALDTFGRVLQPSIIDQYEFGIKTLWLQGAVSVNATAYLISNDNAVQSYPNLAPADTRREAGGQTQSKGFELDIITKNIHGFSINAGYSYNDTRYKKSTLYIPGSRILYTPNHTANTHIYYHVKPGAALKGLNAGMGIYYVGERVAGRSTTKANPGYALMPVPAYFLFETSVGYTYGQVRFRFKVNNILNQLSYNVHDDNSVNPISPRQFTGTLSYTF